MIVYDEEKSNKVLEELKAYRVNLPENIVELGFGTMAAWMARLESYKARVSSLMADIIPQKTAAKIQLDSAKFNYETKSDILIDTDPEIMICTSDKTRIAKANKKLVAERQAVMEATAIHKQFVALSEIVFNALTTLESQTRSLAEICNMGKRMSQPQQPGSSTFQQVYPPKQFPGNQ